MNPYENIRYVDPNVGQQSFMQGMQMGQQIGGQNALSQFAANPDDPEAFKGLARYHPEKAMQVRGQQQQQQQQALEARKDDFILGAQIFRAMPPQDEQSYQAALQAYQRAGGNMQDVPTAFDPAYVQQIVKIADELKPPKQQNEGPSSVQEYQFAKQQGFQGGYMEFMEEKRGPMIASNGDGTFTIIPRGMAQGGQQGAVPPPPPGFVLDQPQGGQTQPASGGFPDPLAPQ